MRHTLRILRSSRSWPRWTLMVFCLNEVIRFGSLADISQCNRHVRFTPRSGHSAVPEQCPQRANSGHRQPYSITASAVVNSDGGIVRPSALAVFRLITNSNFAGCTTGRSAGFSPLRIRPA
jgi:hypothetical protein